MSERCPYCGLEVASLAEEVAHMEGVHRDIIAARLAAIGEPPELRPEFAQAAQEGAMAAGPILGYQAARLGADRLARFMQGHAELQAMAMFLVMTVMTVPQTGYSDAALEALRADAKDVREAAAAWAAACEELADHWQAQREEQTR